MSDDDFVRRLGERAAASVPVIPVETGSVVRRARRRRAVTRSVGALAAVVVLGGAVWTSGAFWPGRTTNPPVGTATTQQTQAASVAPVSAEQRAGLFGMWQVEAEGEGPDTWLRLAGSQEAQLWRDCSVLSVSWAVGPTRFVSEVVGLSSICASRVTAIPDVGWLAAATSYRAASDGWQLLDRSGAVVATLRHADGGPTWFDGVSEDWATAPVVDDAARYWVGDPASLRAGLVAATTDDLTHRWVLTGSPATATPYVELLPDGTWTASDGCLDSGGHWAADVDGRLLVVRTSPPVGESCDGAPLPDLFAVARRAALAGDDLLLFDAEGAQVAQLSRDESTPVASDAATFTCGPDEATVTPGDRIVATRAGVRLVVQNDGAPAGTYLNYRWGGSYGGGTALPTQPTEWQLPIPPGTVDVWCSSDVGSTEWGRRTLTVTDPDGWWDATTIQDLGCAGNAVASWAFDPEDARGASAEEAVERLAALVVPVGSPTVEQVSVGYPEPGTYLVLEDGTPYVVVHVTKDGDGYQAMPDVFCSAP